MGPGNDSRGRRPVLEKGLTSRHGQVQRYISFEYLFQDFGPCLGKAVVGGGRKVRLVVGFRSGRSVVDAAMIFRVIVEEQPRERPHDESITFLLMDVRKAYPNVPWSLCWTVLEMLGLPPRMMNTIQRLNRKTLYLVRTRMGDSATYRFRRCLREGCPSSCVVFDLFHNLALLKLQQNLSEYAVRVAGSIARPLLRRGAELREARDDDWREVMLSVLGFADDSDVLCRKSGAAKVEEITVQKLSEVGEEAHPGKTERMVAGVRDDELPKGFSAAVRFLGPWIDMNGGCVTDTAMRLERAREVWRKVKVKLPMLGVGLQTESASCSGDCHCGTFVRSRGTHVFQDRY